MPQDSIWVPHRLVATEIARGEQILAQHGPDVRPDLKLLSDVEDFMRLNGNLPGWSRPQIIAALIGQMDSDGLWPSTIANRLAILERWHVDPRDTGAARESILNSVAVKAVDAYKGHVGPKRVRPLLDKADLLRPFLYAPTRSDPALQTRRRAFWFVLVATGNRPEHVEGARNLQITPTALGVLWGKRKVRDAPNDYVWYPFAWADAPPSDVWSELYTHGVPHLGVLDPASTINGWLKSLRTGLTSGENEEGAMGLTSLSGRVRLSNYLAEQVKAGEMTEQEFEIVLDHTLEVSMAHYGRREPPVECTDRVV